MANTIKTVITYTLDGSTMEFNIPFEYLARKFISVTLIGVDRKTLTLNSDYRFASRTVISLNRAWGSADGYTTIEFRRYTSASERLVDFTDGSILRAYDLNVAQVQTMHVAEEARDLTADTISVNNDGQLDARGRRIVNVADPTGDYDAINLHTVKVWNESAYTSAENARGYADSARLYRDQSYTNLLASIDSRDAAYGHRLAAEDSMNNSYANLLQARAARDAATEAKDLTIGYRDSAWQYQDWAKGYKESSESSASTAKAEASRAKDEADKLGNMNALGGAIDRVTDSGMVVFKTNIAYQRSYLCDEQLRGVYGFEVSNGNLRLWSDGSLTNGTPLLSAPQVDITGHNLKATGGLLGLSNNVASFQFSLDGTTLSLQRDGVEGINLAGSTLYNGGTISASSLYSFTNVGAGDGSLGTDGNVLGPIWSGGSAKAEMLQKVSRSEADSLYISDVGHGAATANPLNDHQGRWEVSAGHSIVGYQSTVSDGNIRYTNWLSRCLMKKTSGGWIQCGNIA